jgi:hypothetical protein
VALTVSIWTELKFTALPNLIALTAGVLVLDIFSQLLPRRVPSKPCNACCSGVVSGDNLLLRHPCRLCDAAFLASDQDQFFVRSDLALGVNWFDVVRWVDDRPWSTKS